MVPTGGLCIDSPSNMEAGKRSLPAYPMLIRNKRNEWCLLSKVTGCQAVCAAALTPSPRRVGWQPKSRTMLMAISHPCDSVWTDSPPNTPHPTKPSLPTHRTGMGNLACLQGGQVRRQGRLVAHRAGNAPQERRHLAPKASPQNEASDGHWVAVF